LKFDLRRALLTLTTAGAIVVAAPALGYAQGANTVAPGSQIELRQGVSDNDDEVTNENDFVDDNAEGSANEDDGGDAADNETAFLRAAVSDSATEIEAGRLAQSRAGSQEVRQFASLLTNSHQTILQDAARVAASNGVDAPQAPSNDDEVALIDDLSSLSGKEFDETYLRAFVQDQRMAIADYLSAKENMTDDVSAYADRHLGRLSDQLRAALELAARLGVVIEES